MNFLDLILSVFQPRRRVDSEGRIKCKRCTNRVLAHIAEGNGGLCGRCFRKENPRSKDSGEKVSEYHQKLNTPVDELDDDDKRRQLSGAITWKNEARIDELLASGTGFMSKPAKYGSRTWISEAIYHDCSLSIMKKMFAAGGDVNACLEKKGADSSLPLEVAIYKERIDLMEWLLENGANPNLGRPIIRVLNHSRSPQVQLKMLQLLIDHGVDVNQTFDLFGNQDARFNALDHAELNAPQPEIIQYLKAHGARRSK